MDENIRRGTMAKRVNPEGREPAPSNSKGLNRFLAIIDRSSEIVGKLAGYLIIVLAFSVGYDVVMRYLFSRPTVWGQEFSTMVFGTFIILGGAYTLKAGSHVNMDIIHNRLPKKGKAVVDVITFFLLTFPFLGVLIWKGGESAFKSWVNLEHDSTQWGPPLYPFRSMLPVGAFLFFMQAVAKLIRDLKVLMDRGEG